MNKSIAHAALLILPGTLLSPQIMVCAQASQKPRKVVVKKEGWLIPGRDDFKQVAKVVEKNIEGVDVTRKELESPAEIIVDVNGSRVKPYARRKSAVRLFSVRGFDVYESKERVFAYGVELVPVFFIRGKNYWEKTYAGAIYNLFYVDENGDGVFESRYVGLPLRPLPEWVR